MILSLCLYILFYEKPFTGTELGHRVKQEETGKILVFSLLFQIALYELLR